MDGIDVIARLRRLAENLDALGEEDRVFVAETLEFFESGNRLGIPQVLRIVLHFSPLSVMNDQTEGQLPPSAWEETKKQLPQRYLEGKGGMDADTMTATMVEQRRRDACLSCWYIGAVESLAMWREYAPRNGVAIQSTVRRLATCFTEQQIPIRIIPVKYFGPDEQDRYAFEAFLGSLFIKLDQYRVEQELRAVAFSPNVGFGVDVPIKPEELIERVVLSPELPSWAVPVITEAIKKFGFYGAIEKSTLDIRQTITKP